MTSTQIYAKLIEMRNGAGEALYERISLADRLLKDKSWVEDKSAGGGDVDKALTRLEEECFAEVCGIVSLPMLLDVLHHIPNKETWKKYKFNIRRMWADWKAKQTPERRNGKTTKHEATKTFTTPMEFSELTAGRARQEYERVFRAVETGAEKITRLEEENAQLREENKDLKLQMQEMKKGARELFKVG